MSEEKKQIIISDDGDGKHFEVDIFGDWPIGQIVDAMTVTMKDVLIAESIKHGISEENILGTAFEMIKAIWKGELEV